MEELFSMSISLHRMFMAAMVLYALVNIFIVYKYKSHEAFSKKIRFIAPQYYMVMASLFFTGLIALGVMHLALSMEVFLMILAFIVIFIMSIRMHKLAKRTNSKDEQSVQKYRNYVKLKYISDIVILLIVTSIFYTMR